jgi:hypothetical protein
MSAFEKLDWGRFDVRAIVESNGVTAVLDNQRESCTAWIKDNGYNEFELYCGSGFGGFVSQLNELFRWKDQFGYLLSEERCGLDAVRDGFDLPKSEGGSVLRLTEADVLWAQEPEWFLGFLSIAAQYSREQLAVGLRFFTVLVLPQTSPLAGVVYETWCVPESYPNLGRGLFGAGA